MVSFVCLDSTEQWSGSAPDQCVQTIPYFKKKNFKLCALFENKNEQGGDPFGSN